MSHYCDILIFFTYICHMSETKSKILQTAIVVWGNNITTPLDDIASKAGVSRRTLHRHYSGRDDLMKSVFNYIINEYLIEIKGLIKTSKNSENQLKEFLYYDINSGQKYMVFCQLRKTSYMEMASEDANFIELYTLYIDLFKQLKNEKKIRETLSTQWLEVFYTTIIESALKSIDLGLKKEDCLNMAWSSFWNGIKTPTE